MNWWIYFTPIITAAAGWLLVWIAIQAIFYPYQPKSIAGIRLHGLIPSRQKEIAEQIGHLSASLLSLNEIEEKITNPENVKKIMPQAEEHIDHFLRVKLVKSMPVVGMFVGDKTINNLKSLFVTELEQLFPEIMKNYMGRLQEDFNIQKIVSEKIAAIPVSTIEKSFATIAGKEINRIKMLGALAGFIIGWLELLMVLFLR